MPWICQYTPSNCGSPDKNENSTIIEKDYRVGKTINYQCPVGNRLDGAAQRICQSNGFWQYSPPSCAFVDCGPLTNIVHGKVEFVNESRTTFNATAKYSCDENYSLVGNTTRTCLGNGSWSGNEPKCLYSWCPVLTFIQNGAINITNRTENGIASYSCHKGHILVGNSSRICKLGGKWTDEEPVCKFIDCGVPISVKNGQFRLLNGTTFYNSIVKYECDQNYSISGQEMRNCTEHANWNGVEPTCKKIDCGRPDVFQGVVILSDTFTVHSEVHFECEPGHKMIEGDKKRTCRQNGKWDGRTAICKCMINYQIIIFLFRFSLFFKYVNDLKMVYSSIVLNDPSFCLVIECGRAQTILKGEVTYVNSTSYLNSQIMYSCSTGYKLIGTKTRTCNDDGRWSGTTPKCEGISNQIFCVLLFKVYKHEIH